jgi:hypothetical protein
MGRGVRHGRDKKGTDRHSNWRKGREDRTVENGNKD